MLSLILLRNAEPTVVQLTMENLQKELQALNGAELLIEDDWLTGVKKARHNLVCLVEADCLVSSGYFSSMMGLFEKNSHYRQLVMLCSAFGVNNWAPKYYGYETDDRWSKSVELNGSEVSTKVSKLVPQVKNKSTEPYAVDFSYVPGAVIRRNALLDITKDTSLLSRRTNTVKMSAGICRLFQGTDRHIFINPNTTYVTTQEKAK